MKFSARLISYIFHPLLFPTYAVLLLLMVNPAIFGHFGSKIHWVWIFLVFILTFIFPSFWLMMMKRLEMVTSLEMATAKERILPYIATATFYLWTTWMFKPNVNMKIPTHPMLFYLMLGASASVFIAFFINNFSKISLHAVGAGAMLGLVLQLGKISTYDLRVLLPVTIVMCGIIGTSRLLLDAHKPNELVAGYTVGLTGQMLAFGFFPLFFNY